MTPLRDLRLALAFLTRLPVERRDATFDPRAFARALGWFPAVGLLVGAVVGGATAAAHALGLPPLAAGALGLAAGALLTGAFHEDGLADAFDGLGAPIREREQRLAILKDSRVGTFGALALVLWALGCASALGALDEGDAVRAALCAHVLGRWSTLPFAALVRPARPEGSGALARATPAAFALGTLTTAAVLLLAAGPAGAGLALAATAAVAVPFAAWSSRLLGGATGDTFGAANALAQAATLLALAAAWS